MRSDAITQNRRESRCCFALAAIASLVFSGCGGESDKDLRAWMQEQGKGAKGKVDPLPQVKPYEPFTYNAFDLPDPFKPRKIEPAKGASKLSPDLARRREPLESYPLESLQVVGTLKKGNSTYALVRTPEKDVYQVAVGNHIGDQFGVVVGITDAEIRLKELVQDGAGDWIERAVSLSLPGGGAPPTSVSPPAVTAVPPVAVAPPPIVVPPQKGTHVPQPKPVVATASWNTWATRNGRVSTFLEPQRLYDVVLDLSRYAYAARHSAPVDPEVKRAINDAIERGESTLKLTVRPLLFGPGLARAPGFKAEDTLTLNLDRLRTPSDAEAKEAAEILGQIARGGLSIDSAAAQLAAGRITVGVRTTQRTGCAQVVFSIWDEGGTRPLDYVVHTVGVRAQGQAPLDCEQARLQSSFRSLSGVLTAGSKVDVDAALHIIEFNTANGQATLALFLDAERYRAARADSRLADRGVYSWPLITPLQHYVGNQQQLLALITSARKVGNYASAAKELQSRLFPSGGGTDSDDGKALQALIDLTKRKRGAPVVLVRALTAHNVPVYLPLGLLASKDANILSQRISVIYPLPRERYDAAKFCIDRWALGVPQRLDPLSDPVSVASSPRMSRYATIPELIRFLDTQSSPRVPEGRSEALVLLAHQGGGNLWFTDNGTVDRVIPENYKRDYAPGSLALLSACSAVNPKDDNLRVVQLLNDHGIDVVVASPFPIEVSYGVVLTSAFIDAANDAYSNKRNPTVRELFESAAAAAADRLKGQAHLQEKALEFVIVGDHEIRLCRD